MTSLAFVAIGTPEPQGSKTKGRWGNIMDANAAKLAPWRDTVAWSARAALPAGWERLDEPLAVAAWFYFKKPQSAPKGLWHKPTTPDLDKCLRSAFDSITTSGLWKDDARVVSVTAVKHYVGASHGLDVPGLVVGVATLDDADTAAGVALRALDAARRGVAS